jgi:hypothetical protein
MTKVAPTILGVISIAACALLGATEARAATCTVAPSSCEPFVVTIEQVGLNVVATGSGEFDVSGLTIQSTTSVFAPPIVIPSSARMDFSLAPFPTMADVYAGVSGPPNYGQGGLVTPSFATGPEGLALRDPNHLILVQGYTSGTVLSGIDEFDNTTLAMLGITPGTYKWTWGGTFAPGVGGAPDQSFTIIAGTPLPTALPLFATGIVALGLLGWRRKRKAQAVA